MRPLLLRARDFHRNELLYGSLHARPSTAGSAADHLGSYYASIHLLYPAQTPVISLGAHFFDDDYGANDWLFMCRLPGLLVLT